MLKFSGVCFHVFYTFCCFYQPIQNQPQFLFHLYCVLFSSAPSFQIMCLPHTSPFYRKSREVFFLQHFFRQFDIHQALSWNHQSVSHHVRQTKNHFIRILQIPLTSHFIIKLIKFWSSHLGRIRIYDSHNFLLKTSAIAITGHFFFFGLLHLSHSSFTEIPTPPIPSLFPDHHSLYRLSLTPTIKAHWPLLSYFFYTAHIHFPLSKLFPCFRTFSTKTSKSYLKFL